MTTLYIYRNIQHSMNRYCCQISMKSVDLVRMPNTWPQINLLYSNDVVSSNHTPYSFSAHLFYSTTPPHPTCLFQASNGIRFNGRGDQCDEEEQWDDERKTPPSMTDGANMSNAGERRRYTCTTFSHTHPLSFVVSLGQPAGAPLVFPSNDWHGTLNYTSPPFHGYQQDSPRLIQRITDRQCARLQRGCKNCKHLKSPFS